MFGDRYVVALWLVVWIFRYILSACEGMGGWVCVKIGMWVLVGG